MKKKYCVLIFLSLIVLVPIIFMITNSFMSSSEIAENYYVEEGRNIILKFIPEEVTLKQYYDVLLKTPGFLVKFWNSCALVLPIVIGQVLIAVPAAFIIAKFNFPGKRCLEFLIIIMMLLPSQATIVPNYIMLDKLGLIGKNASIILPGLFTALGVFILVQFMKDIPKEMIEAAKIDGAGYIKILTKIIIPQSKGAIISVIILSFADYWNLIEQPMIFLQNESKYPLSVFLSRINTDDIGIAFVCGIIYMLPAVFLFLFGEKYLLDGMKNIEIK